MKPMTTKAYAEGRTLTRIEHRAGTMLALSSWPAITCRADLEKEKRAAYADSSLYLGFEPYCCAFGISKRTKGRFLSDVISAFTAAF